MKPKTDHNELLADVIAGEGDLLRTTREAGLGALRSRRRRRCVGGVLLIVAPVVALIVALFQWPHSVREESVKAQRDLVSTEQVIPGTKIHVLTDDQLLDLFKGRPVALIGPPQNQRLVFLDGSAN